MLDQTDFITALSWIRQCFSELKSWYKNTKLAMQPFIPSTKAVFFNIKGCKDMYNILFRKKKNQSNQFLNGKMRG